MTLAFGNLPVRGHYLRKRLRLAGFARWLGLFAIVLVVAGFTVFRLEVGNYQYPKIMLDPPNASVTTANNRTYGSLSYANLYEYYQAYFQGRTGRARAEFRTRTDLLKRTMYRAALVFSGMDGEGYLVFPLLHDDVRRIVVHIEDVALRFNYADLPVETVDLSFSFERDMRQGYIPMDAVIRN